MATEARDHPRRATARAYIRTDNGRWRLTRHAMPARLGASGLSRHRHEGDGTTPIGSFGFVYAFGSRPNPLLAVLCRLTPTTRIVIGTTHTLRARSTT